MNPPPPSSAGDPLPLCFVGLGVPPTLADSGDSCFLVDVHNDMKLPPTNN